MALVGLIANPVAGRDIRRLVGLASSVPDHEKAAIVRRALTGLAAAGVQEVRYLPDAGGIVAAAVADAPPGVHARALDMLPEGGAEDSTRAARLLAGLGADAILTLGGDGTNRAVAAGCGQVPLACVSTGTNNVFPTMIDGTVAGLAAGLVATGQVDPDHVCRRSKLVNVATEGARDFALVDAAACTDPFVGARAVWDPSHLRALVLARADPWAVGLSSIGGQLLPLGADEPAGLYVELGPGREVRAVLAPGLVVAVSVRRHRRLELEEAVDLAGGGTIALDGERELPARGWARAWVTAGGPRVIDIRAALAAARSAGD